MKYDKFYEALKVYTNDTKTLIEELENVVNDFNYRAEDMLKECPIEMYDKLQQLAYEWVEIWAKAEDWRTDGRNKIATNKCKEVYPTIKIEKHLFVNLPDYAYRMHKTLVQSASNLFLSIVTDSIIQLPLI